METKSPNSEQKIDQSESYHRHQRQRFWQILLPVLFGALAILAVAVLLVLTITGAQTGINLSQYADASSVIVIVMVMSLGFVITLVLFLLVYLLARLLQILPGYTRVVQLYAKIIMLRLQSLSKKTAAPIISVQSVSSGVGGFFSALLGRKRR
jgi:hypothetical protein